MDKGDPVADDFKTYYMGGDYWRVTVQGMRIWMKDFEEIRCDWAGEGAVFFYGRKPATLVNPHSG